MEDDKTLIRNIVIFFGVIGLIVLILLIGSNFV
ncbi:MAG: hypothetical protein Ct9H90mP19_4380 [Gammaproteobacteria bacterium]|nr:MAG: hypothetical protein Ct9H90mP19_4380 [Gammaproteobacteria bacterium]